MRFDRYRGTRQPSSTETSVSSVAWSEEHIDRSKGDGWAKVQAHQIAERVESDFEGVVPCRTISELHDFCDANMYFADIWEEHGTEVVNFVMEYVNHELDQRFDPTTALANAVIAMHVIIGEQESTTGRFYVHMREPLYDFEIELDSTPAYRYFYRQLRELYHDWLHTMNLKERADLQEYNNKQSNANRNWLLDEPEFAPYFSAL